jgi:hypothetical protein
MHLKDALEEHSLSIESVGWLIQQTADRITIVAHWQVAGDDNPSVDGVMTIPICAITAHTVLLEADK